MLARTFSTILLWAATLLAIIYFAAYGWAVIVALLSAAALHEVFEVQRKIGFKPSETFGQIASIAIFLCVWIDSELAISGGFGGSLAFALSLTAISCCVLKHPYSEFFKETTLPTICAISTVPFMLQWLVVLGFADFGLSKYTGVILSIWILAAAKFSDVGAYVLGSAFGRHKMAPSISPKKTWEGAVGGLFSSAAVSATIACGFADSLPAQFTPPIAAVAGILIGAVAILSDLLESVFKRVAGVKDSGSLIPGIGGALDLADSLLLSAPLGTVLLIFILQL